jgi:hypothetical protein
MSGEHLDRDRVRAALLNGDPHLSILRDIENGELDARLPTDQLDDLVKKIEAFEEYYGVPMKTITSDDVFEMIGEIRAARNAETKG